MTFPAGVLLVTLLKCLLLRYTVLFPGGAEAQTTEAANQTMYENYIFYNSLVWGAISCDCLNNNTSANRQTTVFYAYPTPNELFFLYKLNDEQFFSANVNPAPDGTTIQIVSAVDNTCLDVSQGPDDGVWWVVMNKCARDKASQQWRLSKQSSTVNYYYYHVENVDHPEMVITPQGFSSNVGTLLLDHTGKVLSTSPGAKLHLWEKIPDGDENPNTFYQHWAFRSTKAVPRPDSALRYA